MHRIYFVYLYEEHQRRSSSSRLGGFFARLLLFVYFQVNNVNNGLSLLLSGLCSTLDLT